MTDVEIAWLAGFLEGEGSFIFHLKPNKQYITKQWIISVASCDEDVVRRAAELMSASVSGPYWRTNSTKPYWRAWLARRTEVLDLCRVLHPEMGTRRQEQIEALLRADIEHPRRRPGPTKSGAQNDY